MITTIESGGTQQIKILTDEKENELGIRMQEPGLILLGTMSGYEKQNRVYDRKGICPCLTQRDYKDPVRVMVQGNSEICLGQLVEITPEMYTELPE